jgi:hypothetical protein
MIALAKLCADDKQQERVDQGNDPAGAVHAVKLGHVEWPVHRHHVVAGAP